MNFARFRSQPKRPIRWRQSRTNSCHLLWFRSQSQTKCLPKEWKESFGFLYPPMQRIMSLHSPKVSFEITYNCIIFQITALKVMLFNVFHENSQVNFELCKHFLISFSFNPSTSFFEHFQCIFKFGQRCSRCQRGCKSGTSKKIKNGLVKFSWVYQFETRIWLSVVIFWKRFVYYGIYLTLFTWSYQLFIYFT